MPRRRSLARFRVVALTLGAAGLLPLFFLAGDLVAPSWAAAICLTLFAPFVVRVSYGFDDSRDVGLLGALLVAFYAAWGASLVAGLAWLPLALVAAWVGWAPATTAAVALAVGTAEGLAGVSVRRKPRLVRVDVPVPKLPTELDGYRIAHLSDVHVGVHTPPERVRGWVERINALDVDLVAVTGDMITRGDGFVEAMAREIAGLRARDGVMFCMGNHDYFCERPDLLVEALERGGVEVFRNRGRVVGRGDRKLYVAGVDDTWIRRADVPRALAERPPGMPALVLAHDPALFDRAADEGATLVLSGHTHGGQVASPILGRTLNLARLVYRYTAGLYRRGDAHLYVSRGAGTTGLPLRIGAFAEIPVLTLKAS